MEDFVIELAGVPARIRCRFPENREFLKDYLSDREPLFAVEPTPDDLERMQADFERMDEVEGNPKFRRSDSLLENTAIHTLLAENLVQYNVLLMHGSALCMDGQAYIFTAPSGTGKSTHARLWREAFGDRVWMINDDKPMLKITETGVTVYGTPWDGKHHLSRNASAPLRAIAWLTQAETNYIIRMSKDNAFPVIIRQCFGSQKPETMELVVKLEKMLVSSTDFYALGCEISLKAAFIAERVMRTGISW